MDQVPQEPATIVETQAKKKANRTLLWIIAIFIVLFVMPVAACGVFGLALSTGATQQASSATFGPAVGMIRVEGTITGGTSTAFSGVAGSETISDLINKANEDDNIKAILLRIDSPGGGVVASDEIHHALLNVDKPIVVSMGSIAASGGYYIAAPADYIFATPHTLVGSIGVISQFVTAEELLDEVGINVVVITAGESKDFGSFARDMTPEEQAYWQDLLAETHDAFIEVVAEGRAMSEQDVRELATGLVFTGEQSLDLGLVDEIGYLEDAIAKAGELGGIAGEPRVVEFSQEPGFWDAFYGFQSGANTGTSIEILRQMMTPSLEFRYLGR